MNALLLALALSSQLDPTLRLFNPHPVPVEATLCATTVQIAAGDLVDTASCDGAAPVSTLPLVLFEAVGDTQRLVGAQDACATLPMNAPLFACARATVIASVPAVEGASYLWSAEGATIVSGAGTRQVSAIVGESGIARFACTITTDACSRIGSAIVAVRAPLVIRELKASADAEATKPVTISWNYEPGAEPVSQLLMGDAFSAPVPLDGGVRSYPFTPESGGTRTIELRASYARSIVPLTAGRRRAVASTFDAFSVCPSAQASIEVEVRGCAFRPRVNVPDDVVADTNFAVSVELADGESAQWSVENGTIVTVSQSGDRATIRSGATGAVLVRSLVTTAGGCSAAIEKRVPTYQKQCSTPPVAAIELVSQDCDGAAMLATFAGVPPFAGTWSDRTTFRTDANTLKYELKSAGTHRITELHDANCIGSASNAVTVPFLKPVVTLTNEGSCDSGRLVARFGGAPPFNGTWSDGVRFTTSDAQITRDVGPGTWSVAALTDAHCRTEPVSSRPITIAGPPKLVVPSEPSCDHGGGCMVEVAFEGGAPPYTVEWTDGEIAKSVTSPIVSRRLGSSGANRRIEVKSATAAGCSATLANRFTDVIYRESFLITSTEASNNMCVGDERVFGLNRPIPSGATVKWRFQVAPWGTILSGQGTEKVRIRALASSGGQPALHMTVTYADGYCDSLGTAYVMFRNPGQIWNYRLAASTVKVDESTELSFRMTGNVLSTQVYERTSGNHWNLACYGDSCKTRVWSYRPGTLMFDLRWTDCRGAHVETVELVVK